MARPVAIIFDLYGTLVDADSRSLHRAIPKALGVGARDWLEFVRTQLLVRPFDDPEAFARHICDTLAPEHAPALEQECIDIVARELQKVKPKEGIYALLAFLRRRGFRLGLLSNLSSSFKEPLDRLELSGCFDAMVFSCDEGVAKPSPEIYHTLLDRLGVTAAEALFIGDSLANDVQAPESLGVRAVHVGACEPGSGHECVRDVSELGWFDFDADHGTRLLAPGSEIVVESERLSVETLEPVPDDSQGRYNLVYRVGVRKSDGARRALYCKRFLLPESAYVEQFAYELHHAIDLPSCTAEVIESREPFLVVSEAPGSKCDGNLDADLAYEIGRHHVFAFLFSNADMRPRNAFVERKEGSRPVMEMIDLEHCFFNLAIDVAGLSNPERPQTLDELPQEERSRRILKQVLSERAMRRARKTFIETETCAPELVESFRRGFIDQFERVQQRREALIAMMLERVYRVPHLVIGTQSYRRAMGRIDVEDIETRIHLEAEQALSMFT
jgi:HAD superfamily hydrolase (TIGR01509 family)